MQAQYYTSKLSEVEIIKAFDEFCHPDIKVKNNTNSFENNHLVCSLDLPLDPAKEEEGESTLSKVLMPTMANARRCSQVNTIHLKSIHTFSS